MCEIFSHYSPDYMKNDRSPMHLHLHVVCGIKGDIVWLVLAFSIKREFRCLFFLLALENNVFDKTQTQSREIVWHLVPEN